MEKKLRYGSVCSGIEAASVAWDSLGWEPVWFSEIEPFPSEVLKHRFTEVPNLGDMTKLTQNPIFNEEPIDILVGGTPCQSFSIAGLRKGLADPRGNLMLTFLSIADKKKPKWIIWENVPGVLSSNRGRDFGTFLRALGDIGYGWSYRVLDAKYFGVAQRRRRVFVVGYFGNWRPAAAVLFESESLSGYSEQGRTKREETSTDAEGGIREAGKSWWDGGQTAATLTKQNAGGNQRMPDKDNFGAVIEQKDVSCAGGNLSPCVTSKWKTGYGGPSGSNETGNMVYEQVTQPIAVDAYNQTINEKTTQTIGSSASDINHIGGVLQTMAIRRLTPKECERLQGFPDDWTKIPYRNKPADQCPDGPRYKACGNSMAVPVMRWIGQRISMVSDLIHELNKETDDPGSQTAD
jgi:DNA (cytosine-5)-methyltransferase 1